MTDITAGLRRLVEQIETDTLPEMTPEIRALAEKAIQRMDERKDENIEEWASRLAADVAWTND